MAPGAVLDVAEQWELAGSGDDRAVGDRLGVRDLAVVSRDPVVDELADARVRADDDEHRRAAHRCIVPLAE